jgi:hypothetical protein
LLDPKYQNQSSGPDLFCEEKQNESSGPDLLDPKYLNQEDA